MSAPQIAKLIESWDKTFTMPALSNITFNISKRGKNVTIRGWIDAKTFSENLQPWTWNNNFRSSIDIPKPVLMSAFTFFPDSPTGITDKRTFQMNLVDGKYYLYLYNRTNNALTDIKIMGVYINYTADE